MDFKPALHKSNIWSMLCNFLKSLFFQNFSKIKIHLKNLKFQVFFQLFSCKFQVFKVDFLNSRWIQGGFQVFHESWLPWKYIDNMKIDWSLLINSRAMYSNYTFWQSLSNIKILKIHKLHVTIFVGKTCTMNGNPQCSTGDARWTYLYLVWNKCLSLIVNRNSLKGQ